MRCYVGRVEELDDRGLRITLVDWIIGRFTGWDFFLPWDAITSVMVATPEHSTELFGDAASEFQIRCNEMANGEEAVARVLDERRLMKAEALRNR
jgi:hypothetical protein